MSFVKKNVNTTKIEDNVFKVLALAKEDIKKNGKDKVVNATIGSLCDEDGNLVALDSVYKNYDKIDDRVKASYAQSFVGNKDYLDTVKKWILKDKVNEMHSQVIASVGGTGAISMAISNILDTNETLLLPDIAWGSYKLMAQMFNLQVQTYAMFEKDSFNIASFKQQCLDIIAKQNKLLVVINDPCHNPTGYSMSKDEWKEVISFINECSKKVPCIILNDIAYIDYSFDVDKSRDYIELFNACSDNTMVIITFSCSKSMTSYGLRCGAGILLSNNEKALEETLIVFEKSARAVWSNIPNAAMENFAWVINENTDEYLKEKSKYITLLKERSVSLMKELDDNNIPYYPFKEGFFLTIKCDDNEYRNVLHQKLIDNHIYTVAVNKGLRVAICSMPLKDIKGIGSKIKSLM